MASFSHLKENASFAWYTEIKDTLLFLLVFVPYLRHRQATTVLRPAETIASLLPASVLTAQHVVTNSSVGASNIAHKIQQIIMN